MSAVHTHFMGRQVSNVHLPVKANILDWEDRARLWGVEKQSVSQAERAINVKGLLATEL